MPALFAWALVAFAGTLAAIAQDEVRPDEQSRVRLLSVKVRFEPGRDALAGECNALTLDDLEVSLRGRRLPRESLVELARERRPAIHALLIDTSGSMVGKLDYARAGAVEYLNRLDPELDSSFAVTFDESVILLGGAKLDHSSLVRAVGGIRMGLTTSMFDALYYALRELEGHRERPVVVLLTDGIDSGSLYEQDDVRRLSRLHDDLTIFTIGYQLPAMQSYGPAGRISTRKFLQNVARWSNGKFFDVPTGSRLSGAFEKIHEMLENEAVLTVIDPTPDAEDARGRIKVDANHPRCGVKVFRRADVAATAEGREAIEDSAADATLPFPPGERIREWYEEERDRRVEPECRDAQGAASWSARLEPHAIQACALDITMETGLLYDSTNVRRWQQNEWLELRVRPLEIPVPAIDELPHDPAESLDRLAEYLLDEASANPETDFRQRPASRHARPYHDIPGLCHGRTFLDSRGSLARALNAFPEYRAWARTRLERQAGREIERLQARFRRYAPDRPDHAVRDAVVQSSAGQAALRRAQHPDVADLQNHLAAWLGDLPARELFERWELLRINRALAATGDGYARFEQEWIALRRLFFVPSYARVLTLLTPVHDLESDRIGFWRVVLPRPGWLLPRVRGNTHHPEYGDLPLDLIPDLPLGFLILDRAVNERPEVRDRLVGREYRAVKLTLDLLSRPHRHDPRRAFLDVHVLVVLRGSAGHAPGAQREVRVSGHVTLDRDSRFPTVDDLIIEGLDDDERLHVARN